MDELGGIRVWIAIIAVASVVQVLMLIGAAVVAAVAYKRATDALEVLRRTQIDPLMTRAHAALDEVHVVLDRAKAAEVDVRQTIQRTTERVKGTANRMVSTVWPVVGLGRGVWAVFAALSGRRAAMRRGIGSGVGYEGGMHHV